MLSGRCSAAGKAVISSRSLMHRAELSSCGMSLPQSSGPFNNDGRLQSPQLPLSPAERRKRNDRDLTGTPY